MHVSPLHSFSNIDHSITTSLQQFNPLAINSKSKCMLGTTSTNHLPHIQSDATIDILCNQDATKGPITAVPNKAKTKDSNCTLSYC